MLEYGHLFAALRMTQMHGGGFVCTRKLPHVIQKLLALLQQTFGVQGDEKNVNVIVRLYEPRTEVEDPRMRRHVDDKMWGADIMGFILEADERAALTFAHESFSSDIRVPELDNSAIHFRGFMREKAAHFVPSVGRKRISFTFRFLETPPAGLRPWARMFGSGEEDQLTPIYSYYNGQKLRVG